MPAKFEPAEHDARLAAVLLDADEESGRALRIERVQLRED
jgi:calcineurin-like phosphoesterase